LSTCIQLRRLATTAAAAFFVFAASAFTATSAQADDVGHVRLAHLAPDCGMVDVYLTPQAGTAPAKVIPSVDYGSVSDYFTMPPGPYAVALREAGGGPSSPVELATQITVETGHAYTVAALGMRADLGARVLNDDLSMAPAGKARLRIVQAAAETPLLNVSVANGANIADQVSYPSATDYRVVDQGRATVQLRQPTGARTTSVDVSLEDGSVYSLFVLDKKSGLTAELRSDALRKGQVPVGGMETGAGGSQPRSSVVVPVAVLFVLCGAIAAGGARRRRRSPVRARTGR
jgi:hypothetical protein